MKKKEVFKNIIVFDIETAPYEAYVWGTFEQNVALNQIKRDRSVLAWAAKPLGGTAASLVYRDTRHEKDPRNDKAIMKDLHRLLRQADVVVTQNGKRFDFPIVKGRFALHGFEPLQNIRHIDTYALAKKFGFTSNKLEYLSNQLNTKYKKLKHSKFEGFSLWEQCLAGNRAAWREMEKYNKHDVLATEELYERLAPWGIPVNLNVFRTGDDPVCTCGSKRIAKEGFAYTQTGKFQRYSCQDCGAKFQDRGMANNLLTKSGRKRG